MAKLEIPTCLANVYFEAANNLPQQKGPPLNRGSFPKSSALGRRFLHDLRMLQRPYLLSILRLGLVLLLVNAGRADIPKPYAGVCQAPAADFFTEKVWPTIGAHDCLKCHKTGGDAEESKFVLQDPTRAEDPATALLHNHEQFAAMARTLEKDESVLLLKSTGKLKHEGEEVLKPDSPAYHLLQEFVQRIKSPQAAPPDEAPAGASFYEGITMISDRRLLRRVTLSLAARLPRTDELEKLTTGGLVALPALMDSIMQEPAFYERLREAFNDIFLTVGLDDNPETVLSYEHFEKTRLWYQKHDFSAIKDEKERTQAGYKLAREYRKAIEDEPMRLIEYIVRENHPFTEIITADYIMVSPFSSRGYGVFEEMKDKFKNPEDPYEYQPVKLKALAGRNRSEDQESATGFYPHAGILSTFQYLRRYPTTETNRNRLRARMFYQHFLGIDVLELAARVSDAAAVTAKYEIPTMQASECVVCHKTLDPVASLFQDFWRFDAVYGKRKEGWFKDMFQAGFEGTDMPTDERWRSLQWLGSLTAKDPRFATAMVGHAYYLLTGRKLMLPPKDLADPFYQAKRRAYLAQHQQVESIAQHFAADKFNFKTVIKDWVLSNCYRADGQATASADPARQAELEDVGLCRLLAPEQVERKVAAVFGKQWGKLKEQMELLYGGIDSKEVTERATDPSGAMGALQRILANDVACRETALDFSHPSAERRLFPCVETDTLPDSAESEAKIRQTIVHLHELVLGRQDEPNAPEVTRTYELFAGIVNEAATRKVDPAETWSCRQGLLAEVPDPKYTVRAWRAVLTFLLRQHEFLYE